jgi:radical SAM superfamily enzyme YgiQ (UPF0313 family)
VRILYLPNEYSQQRQRDVKANIYPVLMAMECEWHRQNGDDVYWMTVHGEDTVNKIITEPEGLPFLNLPAPDRIFTQYQDYTSGNYKYLPATHMQVADGCWHGKCSFCVENGKPYQVRSIDSVMAEIKDCVKLGIKEIFDDSGTFPVGDWFKDFCQRMISTGLNKKVVLGCNMRFGALDLEDFDLMKQAGFRMILWGLESVNQDTLDRLSKGIRFEQAVVDLELANRYGLWSHVAVMFGYPWEDYEDSRRTYDFIKQGMLTNKIKTAQASIYDVPELDVSPLLFEDSKFRDKVYKLYHDPRYLWHRIREIKNWEDIRYYLRGVKKLLRRNK